jgi:hypothetical protein
MIDSPAAIAAQVGREVAEHVDNERTEVRVGGVALVAPGGRIITTPLYTFYREPLRKYTGRRIHEFTAEGLASPLSSSAE